MQQVVDALQVGEDALLLEVLVQLLHEVRPFLEQLHLVGEDLEDGEVAQQDVDVLAPQQLGRRLLRDLDEVLLADDAALQVEAVDARALVQQQREQPVLLLPDDQVLQDPHIKFFVHALDDRQHRPRVLDGRGAVGAQDGVLEGAAEPRDRVVLED